MKRLLKLFSIGICFIPMVANATLEAPDYEILWGYIEDNTCGIGSVSGKIELTSYSCVNKPSGEEELIATFTRDDNTLIFENNKSTYNYGGPGEESTITTNGNNEIAVLYSDKYIINGNGSLKIDGLYNSENTLDENNNQLYYVVFNDIDGKQYVVLNEDGTKFLVTSKEDFEAKFASVKEYNEALENIEYDENAYFINPHYHVVPLAITEDWVNNNITTDLKVTYNDDGSVLIGEIKTNIDNETSKNTNDEEKESNSNLNIPIAIGIGAIIGIGITVILFKKRK